MMNFHPLAMHRWLAPLRSIALGYTGDVPMAATTQSPGECSPSFIRLEINIVDAQAPTRTGTGRHPSHNGIDPSRPVGPTCWSNRPERTSCSPVHPVLRCSLGRCSIHVNVPRAARTPAGSIRFSPESAPNGVRRSRHCSRTQQPWLVLE